MNRWNTYGEYTTRYYALKSHPNAIIRKHLGTGMYIAFYYISVYQQAKKEGDVR